MEVRSIFLSDLHLGWGHSKASKLPSLLTRLHAQRLYLVGDTFEWIDQSSHPSIPERVRPILNAIDRLASRGCEVILLPGNHDWQLSRLDCLGSWRVTGHAIHETALGERFFVTHGDLFDTWIRRQRSFSWFGIGNHLYNPLLQLGRWLERSGLAPPAPDRHWCSYWKQKLRSVRRHVLQFSDFMVRLARLHQCHGVICGHIHVPAVRRQHGFTYVNCGDWIEHCSMVVEDGNGRLSVMYEDTWRERSPDFARPAYSYA